MENTSRKTVQIGRYDDTLPGTENKMVLCEEGFATLGIPTLHNLIHENSEWIRIDEIGYLECKCSPYLDALQALLQTKRVAAVVRKQNLTFLQDLCSRDDVFLLDLDQPFGHTGCVIMASGLGNRFGSNKLLADFNGSPLICRILDATEGIFADRVVVTRYKEIAQLCQQRKIRTVFHELPHRNDTVRLGLEALSHIDRCMFCPGDQPLLRQETIAALVLASVHDPDSIWRTTYKDTPGSPVVFPSWAFSELRNLPEGKGGGYIIHSNPDNVKLLNVKNPFELKDIDTPEDLTSLIKQQA